MVVNSGGSKAWGQEGSGGNHLYYSGEWGDKVKIGDKSGSDVDYVTVWRLFKFLTVSRYRLEINRVAVLGMEG